MVRHFAGTVEYTVSAWLDKNKDLLSMSCRECLLMSSLPLVSSLFSDDESTDVAVPTTPGKGGSGGASAAKTLGTQFKNQLIGLVSNLRLTEPLFIRCVKPNHEKVPSLFTGELALRQLRYAGLFEAIRIRKSGYAYRVTHDVFANMYSVLVDGLLPLRREGKVSSKDACIQIFRTIIAAKKFPSTTGIYQVGNSKVFIKTNQLRTVLDRIKAEAVVGFSIKLQSVARGFISRMRTFAERYALEKAKRKLEEELQRKVNSIICVQKYIRRFLVKKMLKSMKNLIELRKALAMRDARKVQEIVERIETCGVLEDDELAELFKKEVTLARAMMRLIKLQDSFADQVEEAIRESDVSKLNQYLIKAEKMEMTNHPVIFAAKQELNRLHRKKRVIKNMIDFLHNETGNTVDDRVAEMIVEARTLGVDPDFVGKVQRVFDAAGPRLRVRNRLRRGVETVDKFSITHALADAMKLRAGNAGFAELEIRSARAMLQLLKFDKLLHPNAWKASSSSNNKNNLSPAKRLVSEFEEVLEHDDLESTDIEADGPRISAEILILCDRISICKDAAAQKKMKQLLKETAITTEQLEIIVRSYKWSKTLSVWKYPEILESQKIVLPPAELESKTSSPRGSVRPSAAAGLTTPRKASADAAAVDGTPSTPKGGTSFSRLSMSLLGGTNLFDTPSVDFISKSTGAGNNGSSSPSTPDTDETELDFYGLRFSSVRVNPYIIRQLHKDIDPVLGEAPASIKAAIGAPELPPMISESLKQLECLNISDKAAMRLETGAKSALPVTPSSDKKKVCTLEVGDISFR
jgi:myosin heavy subunit